MIDFCKKTVNYIIKYQKTLYNTLVFLLLLHAASQEQVPWYAVLEVLVALPLASEPCRIILARVKDLGVQTESATHTDTHIDTEN